MAKPGARVELDWDEGLRRAARQLAEMAQGDFSPLMESIGEELTSSTKGRFAAGRGPDGKKWDGLKRRRKRKGQRPLLATGRLRRSITSAGDADAVAVGSASLVYAATHQFGDERRGIPARPFVGISPEDEIEIRDLAVDYLAVLGGGR